MVQHQLIHNFNSKNKDKNYQTKSETYLQCACSIANDLDIFKQIHLKY